MGSPPPLSPLPTCKVLCVLHICIQPCVKYRNTDVTCATSSLKMPKSWVCNLDMFGWNFLYYVLLCDLSSFQSQKSSGVCFLSETFSSGLEHWCKKKERRRKPVYIMLSDLHCCLGFIFFRCLVCEAFQFCGKTLQTYIMGLWYSAHCGARHSCRFFTCMCMRWK